MADCYCDYDVPAIYRAHKHKARTEHKCHECGAKIQPGETYERVFAIWDGDALTYKTCSRCLALRDFVEAHIPCFCWAHGIMREDAIEAAKEWAHETVGLLFGVWRREALIRRAKKGSGHG